MNYRLSKIYARTLLTDDTTETFDINVKDPISRIVIQYDSANTDSVPDGHPTKAVTKVELVDGSDVLYSLSAEQICATDFYDNGRAPLSVITYIIGNRWRLLLNLNFGRYLWDPELAFDPSRFLNPQLKVTHKVTDIAGSGCSSPYITIWAHCFDEKKVTPAGFLMNKEIHSYVMGDEHSHHYIDLPTDYPVRRMMVQALHELSQPWQIAHDIKISEDNDKRIPFEEAVSNYLKIVCPEYGRYHETVLLVPTGTGQQFNVAPAYEICLSNMNLIDADGVMNTTIYPQGGTCTIASSVAGCEACMNVEGYAPFGTIPIFCGQQKDIADWYDVSKVGSLVADITAGSLGATATIRFIMQQYRTY